MKRAQRRTPQSARITVSSRFLFTVFPERCSAAALGQIGRITPADTNQELEWNNDSGRCLLMDVPSVQSVAAVASAARYRVLSTRSDGDAA